MRAARQQEQEAQQCSGAVPLHWVGGWWCVGRVAVELGGNGWEWVGTGGNGWERVGTGGNGWEWVGMGGNGWEWVGMGGNGWEWVGMGMGGGGRS